MEVPRLQLPAPAEPVYSAAAEVAAVHLKTETTQAPAAPVGHPLFKSFLTDKYMKNTLLFALILMCVTVAAQKPQPVQIQTVNDSVYIVEYVPIAVAQANVDAQQAQVDKELARVDKQIADLIAKHEKLIAQQKALAVVDTQLQKAATPPPSTGTKSAPVTTTPTETKPPKKPKKQKSKN